MSIDFNTYGFTEGDKVLVRDQEMEWHKDTIKSFVLLDSFMIARLESGSWIAVSDDPDRGIHHILSL